MDLALHSAFFLVVGSFGSFMRDLHESLTNKNNKIRVGEVVVGGFTSMMICLGLSDTLFAGLSVKTMFLVAFVLGVVGFEVFGKISTLRGVKNFIQDFRDFKSGRDIRESGSTGENNSSTATPSETNQDHEEVQSQETVEESRQVNDST